MRDTLLLQEVNKTRDIVTISGKAKRAKRLHQIISTPRKFWRRVGKSLSLALVLKQREAGEKMTASPTKAISTYQLHRPLSENLN